MEWILIICGAVLLLIGIIWWQRLSRTDSSPSRDRELWSARPTLLEFHVEGEVARVIFDASISETETDPILAEMLIGEAIEVVREKRDHLPITEVTRVVVLAGKPDPVPVGETKLKAPGRLPPRPLGSPLQTLTRTGSDPLDRQFQATDKAPLSSTSKTSRDTSLPPISTELNIPGPVERGLRAIGIDTETMTATELVVGTLKLSGYRVEPTSSPSNQMAHKEGKTTLIQEDFYQPDGHQVVEEKTLRSFMAQFSSSGADRGVLVSDKYAPYQIYEMEQRQPKCRFLTRERLQGVVDTLAWQE